MNFDCARKYLLSLPYVIEAEQFGGLIYWVGDKAIGGKMFAHMNVDPDGMRISYPAGAERFHELLERDGLVPAPYLARASWVAAERWDALRKSEWESELQAAHTLTLGKLPGRTRKLLEGSKVELKREVAARKKALAGNARD